MNKSKQLCLVENEKKCPLSYEILKINFLLYSLLFFEDVNLSSFCLSWDLNHSSFCLSRDVNQSSFYPSRDVNLSSLCLPGDLNLSYLRVKRFRTPGRQREDRFTSLGG